jgi:hypothetical protein
MGSFRSRLDRAGLEITDSLIHSTTYLSRLAREWFVNGSARGGVSYTWVVRITDLPDPAKEHLPKGDVERAVDEVIRFDNTDLVT